MIAKQVLDGSAALLNDTQLSIFTYAAQIPYLNIALQELQEELELNNVPVTNKRAAIITITSGIEGIGGGNGKPNLPPGFIEPVELFERTSGSQYAFIDMKRCDFLPVNQVPTAYLIYWSFNDGAIQFIPGGATGDVDVQIDYVKSIFVPIGSSTDQIEYDKGLIFLTYRNAALCAEFIGENKTRADDLNVLAGLGLQRALGISTKGRQQMNTRRRPFMAGWRARRIL